MLYLIVMMRPAVALGGLNLLAAAMACVMCMCS